MCGPIRPGAIGKAKSNNSRFTSPLRWAASREVFSSFSVPEGFLFRKDLTKTREYLLDHCQLQSIISLPQGVFLPYTGVKTDIIYATKVNQKVKSSARKKSFWYFDVKSDGYILWETQ